MSKDRLLACAALFLCVSATISSAGGRSTDGPGNVELARHEAESSSAHVESVRVEQQNGIAVVFTGTDDLHYYAKPETAPAPGFELKVAVTSDDFEFGDPVFPKWKWLTNR